MIVDTINIEGVVEPEPSPSPTPNLDRMVYPDSCTKGFGTTTTSCTEADGGRIVVK